MHLQGAIKVLRVVVRLEQGYANHQGLTLDLRGQEYQGMSLIELKREIHQAYGPIDLRSATLNSVTLIAKSRAGRGQATLLVGPSQSYPANVPGRPYDFHSERPASYKRVMLNNTSYNSAGKWMVQLQGNIKVDKVILNISGLNGRIGTGPRPRPRPPVVVRPNPRRPVVVRPNPRGPRRH